MVLTRLTIDLYFKPSVTSETLRKLIQAPFKIHCERSDKGITLISIEHPTEIGTDNINTESYNHWYVDFIKTNYNVIKQCGLEEINIFIDVFFHGQCNFEIFNNKSLSELSKYNVSLPISVYELPYKELKDMLIYYGYSSDEIQKIFQYEGVEL